MDADEADGDVDVNLVIDYNAQDGVQKDVDDVDEGASKSNSRF